MVDVERRLALEIKTITEATNKLEEYMKTIDNLIKEMSNKLEEIKVTKEEITKETSSKIDELTVTINNIKKDIDSTIDKKVKTVVEIGNTLYKKFNKYKEALNKMHNNSLEHIESKMENKRREIIEEISVNMNEMAKRIRRLENNDKIINTLKTLVRLMIEK